MRFMMQTLRNEGNPRAMYQHARRAEFESCHVFEFGGPLGEWGRRYKLIFSVITILKAGIGP
jgi:hypothetical protein